MVIWKTNADAPGATRPQDLLAKLADPAYNISFENHMFGLPPSHYDKWPVLGEQFNILSTTLDRRAGRQRALENTGKSMRRWPAPCPVWPLIVIVECWHHAKMQDRANCGAARNM